MKLDERKIVILDWEDPINVTSYLNVSGGSLVQFYDGVNYMPNREGALSSPILLTHNLSAASKSGEPIDITFSTLFYENDVLISSSNSKYELMGNSLKVKKNIEGGKAVVIKAVSKFIHEDSDVLYERIDTATLRTIIKSEAPYQMNLSERGVVYFDGYKNPNVRTSITASLKKGEADVTNFNGITFKWLNAAGLDCLDNELYADEYSNGGRTITIDKTYIDKDTIRCQAWKDNTMIASDTVTYVRKFNSFRPEVRIPELPLQVGVDRLTCTVLITDNLGNVDVDSAFLADWMVSENGVERKVATGSSVQIPTSSINMKAADLKIYPDVKRREAFAGLTGNSTSEEVLYTDDHGRVLTIETYGN